MREYLQKSSLYQIPFCLGITTKKYVKILWLSITNYVNGADPFLIIIGLFFDFTAILHSVNEIGAREYTCQAIVVFLGYGIVFVIMALGAGDREPEESTGECVDLFRPFLGFHCKAIAIVVFMTKSDEAKRRQVCNQFFFLQIGC